MKLSGSKKKLFTRQFWRSLETKYYLLFLLAVFFTLSSIGFVSDLLNNLHYSYSQLITAVIVTGLLSVGYVYAGTRKLPLFAFFISLQLIYIFFFQPEGTTSFSKEELDLKFTVVASGILFCVTLGYIFFITFITKVGINHFLMSVEMDLAKSIHEVLVPDIKYKDSTYEIFGRSVPTSDVGGDLIDVMKKETELICVISDVSGHGVSSGVYTGMFKSSVRTILQSKNKLNEILQSINTTLQPLMKKNMFITSAMIKFDNTNRAEFSVAGHLPILHYKKTNNSFDELIIKQIPLGFKSDFNYSSLNVNFQKGDLFVLITDGITETTDKKNNEYGMERLKEVIQQNNDNSAEEISDRIFKEVQNFGNQKDDITLMVIKC